MFRNRPLVVILLALFILASMFGLSRLDFAQRLTNYDSCEMISIAFLACSLYIIMTNPPAGLTAFLGFIATSCGTFLMFTPLFHNLLSQIMQKGNILGAGSILGLTVAMFAFTAKAVTEMLPSSNTA